ncbi:hypothetical protein GF345_02730 [Candidatus Woesearchaeota archaeon]|nr:hypothetical protein [Candidatus Woesearchaeota archaeon]
MVVILAASAAAEDLMIQDFEIDSVDEDDEVKPGETLTITFDVVNVISDDIEDIEVELWFERSGTKLEDKNGDRINPEFDLNDIDAGDDKDIRYEFEIPWEVDDGDRWDIMVRVKGRNAEDSSRVDFEDTFGEFKIEKDSHELFVDASFDPETVDCGDHVQLDVLVRNIGTNDEENVNITIINTLIGINKREVVYLDEDPEEDDNYFEETYSFNVNDDLNPGLYELTVRAKYDNGYEEAYKTITLDVANCQFSAGSQTGDSSDDSDDQDGSQDSGTGTSDNDSTAGQTGTQQPTTGTTAPVNYVPATPSASPKDGGSDTTLILLIVVGEVALIIIIVLVYLLVRKPKPKAPEYRY